MGDFDLPDLEHQLELMTIRERANTIIAHIADIWPALTEAQRARADVMGQRCLAWRADVVAKDGGDGLMMIRHGYDVVDELAAFIANVEDEQAGATLPSLS